ncbi:S8 family serine peptidase [Bathymodiolus thermophilus thioautotrophic gill symbiont]|uniref:Uncharacterized protein n=1 Tax=Bathymodiolus thermophilus thioautotrophic gill symbiont TaxID=2360 RepID=A0A1J5UI46_9GAMM|nr:S8 family serine peptidase [Bathymodiolus thermophilus thioautotrophic gill symbiont]OIR23951.1 hypothetical protein BGC33_14205 [Bathymodiolus thermophilus thioautotrophic gill symbiont]
MKINSTMSKIALTIMGICLFLIAYFLFFPQDQVLNQYDNNSIKPTNQSDFNKNRELFTVKFSTPLTSEQINKYADYGMHNIVYKNLNTYYAHISKEKASNLKNIITDNEVLNVNNIDSNSKIPYYIQRGEVESWAITKDGSYKLNIEFIEGISPQNIKDILLKYNIPIIDESIIENFIISVKVSPNLIKKLASLKEIIAIDTVTPPMAVNNTGGAIANNVYPLQEVNLSGNNYNLSGEGIKVQVVDGGSIRGTHQEFNKDDVSRVINITHTSVSRHATHVAGTIGASGIEAKAKGMATKVSLYGDSFLDSSWEKTLIENGFNLYGLRISNHSYGMRSIYRAYLGRYLLNSKEMDDSIYNNPKLLVVKAAGNDRGNTLTRYNKKYGIIKGIGNSKNVLTIGAASNDANAVTKTNGMTSFSSWGPVLDGRIKPDVVANGENVYSSTSKSDSDYGISSGTSMAAPIVSGISALIAQEYKNITGSQNIRADMLKALLVNTATDLGNVGPDYSYGFGMINAKKAVNAIKALNNKNKIFLNSITNNQNKIYRLILKQDSEVKITLSWLDSGADVTSQNNTLVNDIDILLFGNNEYFYPYTLNKKSPSQKAKQNKVNSVDNTEQIKFNLKAGRYTFKVSGKRITNEYQPYAIVSSHDLIADEDITFDFNQMTLPDLVKGSGEIRTPIGFISSDNGFAYIDAYSEDDKLIIDVDKNNILTVKSAISNTNDNSNITINALVGDRIFTKTLNINLLDPVLMFKPTLNLYKNTQITNTVNYKHIVVHNNKIYASDYINNTINVYGLNGVLLTTIGSGLSNPKGLAFKGNKLYVANSNHHQIQVYNNGILESSFGEIGSGDGQFNMPNAIAIDANGTIFISDNLNKRVQIFDNQHNFIKTLEFKLGGKKFYDVTSLVFNSKNELFIVDRYSNKIHKFDSRLNHVGVFGGYGNDNGKFDFPDKIFSDINDNLYILDKNSLQIFNSSGNFIRKIDNINVKNITSLAFTQSNIYAINSNEKISIFNLFSLRKKYNENNELLLTKNDFVKDELYNNAATVTKIKITDLPSDGKLYNNDREISKGELISVLNISLKYVPNATPTEDSFQFSAGNENGFTHNSMRIITEKNITPTLSIDDQREVTLDENGEFDFFIIDGDNKTFRIRITFNPAHGTIQVIGNTIKYTADDDYSGTDTFTIEIDDGDGGVISKTINVNINEINNYPVIKNLDSNAWQYLPDIVINDITSTGMYFDRSGTPYNVSVVNSDIAVNKFDSNQWQVLNFPGKVYRANGKDVIDFNSSSTPYIIFSDVNHSGRVAVMKRTSINNWQYVGASDGISEGVANYYSIQINNDNIPYIIYEDSSKLSSLTVKKFDGTNWVEISDTGFDNSDWQEESQIDGFNKHINSKLLIDGDDIYVIFKNYENKGKIGVKKLINGNWENILLEDTQDNFVVTHLDAVINSENELLISYINSDNKLSVKKYSNNQWIKLGGGDTSEQEKLSMSIGVNDDNLVYISYLENGLLKIKFFNHERWQQVKGFNGVDMASLNMHIVNNKIFINYIKNNHIKTLHYDGTIRDSVLENEQNSVQIISVDADDVSLRYEVADGFDSHLFNINTLGRISFISPPKYSKPKDFNKDNVYLLYVKVLDKEGFTLARVEIKVNSKDGFGDRQGDGSTSSFVNSMIRSFNISLTDEAGNESNIVTFSVTKDTQAPNKPHINNIPYTTINNKETVVIEGQIGTYVYLNDTNTNKIIGNSGTVEIDLNILNDADNNYKISLKDGANNESEALEFIIRKLTYVATKTYAQLGQSNLVNAQVNIYEIVSSGNLKLIASHTTDNSGAITINNNSIENNKFYLYEASSGNGNKGTIRAVTKGQWLRNRTSPFIISLASEMIYDFVAQDIKYNFSNQALENKINQLAPLVVNDLNNDLTINGKDTILYNQDIHTNGINSHYQNIKNEIIPLILNNDLSYINLVFKDQTPKQYINIISDNISSALFSKDEKYAYISTDQGLRILDISNPLSVQEVAYHKDSNLKNITQAYLSDDSKFYVAIDDTKKYFKIVDLSKSPKLESTINYKIIDSAILDVKFGKSSNTIVFLYENTIAQLMVNSINNIYLSDKTRLGNLFNEHGAATLLPSKDGKTFYITGANDNKIIIVDLKTLRVIKIINLEKIINKASLLSDENNLLGLNKKSLFLINIEDKNNPIISSQYNTDIGNVKFQSKSLIGNQSIYNTLDGYTVIDINDKYKLTKNYTVESTLDAINNISSYNGYRTFASTNNDIVLFDYDMFKHSFEQDRLLDIKNDFTTIVIYGRVDAKVYIDGVYTGVNISSNGSASLLVNYNEYANSKSINISVRSGNEEKSFVIRITKDTQAPNKPHINNIPYTTINNKETVVIEGQIGTYVYLNDTNTNKIIGNSGTVEIDLNILNDADNNYKISLKDGANNESEALEFIIRKLTYVATKTYAQLGQSNLVNAQVNIYEIVSSGNLKLIASHTTDNSGAITINNNSIENNKFYLYEASSGNGNKGTIRAVTKGQWLRNRTSPFIISLASEMIYDFVAQDIKYNFSNQALENKINQLAPLVVNDLNNDLTINGKDTILYNQDIHTNGINSHYQNIKNEIIPLILNNDLSYINLVFKDQTPKQYINIINDNISSALFSKDEKYAYISTDQGLRILDISNPLSVQEVAYHKDSNLKNITQAYLSDDSKFYVAIDINKKKFVVTDVSSFDNIRVSDKIVYFSDSTNDEIIDAKFIQNNNKLYLLSKKAIGYYLVNDFNDLELKRRVGGLRDYMPEFKSFAVSNNEQIYLIGQNNTEILILDMPSLTLTNQFSVTNKNANSIHLTNNDTRLSLHDEFGIILFDIAKNNSLSLAGYKYLGAQQSKSSIISTYGDSFFISKENELSHHIIDKNNLISQSYNVNYLSSEHKVQSLKGDKFYIHNALQVKMYDYSSFIKKNYIDKPVLLSDFNEYTNQNSIVLKIAGNRGDSILIDGRPVEGIINSFFAKDIHYTLNTVDGANKITVQFKNNMQLSDKLTINITKDTVPPEIMSFSPADKDIISNDYIGINLEYDDNVGIDVSSSNIYIDNQEIDNRAIGENSFVYNLGLDDKRHKITANIVDYAGNKTVHEYTFTIDTKIPVVMISKPSGNYSYDFHVELSSFKNNTIYYTLDSSEPTANSKIYIAPIHINTTKTLKYFAQNTVNAKASAIQTQIYNLDLSGPQVLFGYPKNGQTLGGTDEFIYKFQSSSDIDSVRIFDEFGNDLSHLFTLDGNVLSLKAGKNKYKKYNLIIVIRDNQGNETRLPVQFSVDKVAPKTRISINGGHFSQKITVDLRSDENATIYYSIDGYPPIIGATNTLSATSPIKGINIDSTTNLQFFAVDDIGNIEQTKSEVYYFNTLSSYNANLQAVHQQNSNKVDLSWMGEQGSTASYNLYKVENVIAKSILQKSIDLSYRAPKKYLLTTTVGNTYSDTSILNSSKYSYAVSQVVNGVETLISTIIDVNINNNTDVTTKQESINRARAYLNKTQNIDGTWSSGRFKSLVTSQVIEALHGFDANTYARNKALYYIKGQYANNNDLLARKIIVLANHNINSDSLVNKLLSQGGLSSSKAWWGAYKGFKYSAYETALAIKALRKRRSNQQNAQYNNFANRAPQLLNLINTNNANNASTWQSNSYFTNDYSVYVSALSHSVKPNNNMSGWLIQAQDGSYGDGLLDTAGVLLYIDNISSTNKSKAINYIVSQQEKDGSFGDIAITAICLNALRKVQ